MTKIIKASILQKKERKYWYIRYQIEADDAITQHEVTSKVSIMEKSRSYMEEIFIPKWIKSKEEELTRNKGHSTLFEYYADLYFESCKNFRDCYSMQKRLIRISRDFGRREISSISELDIELWINNLKHKETGIELTKATRKKYKTTFNKIFTLALKDKAIDINFIDNIEVVGKQKDKNATNTFSSKEVHLLIEHSKDTNYGELLHPYLGLVFNLGLSPSEAIALKVDSIKHDQNNGVKIISINRSISRNKEGATKNEYRNRDIVLRKQAEPYMNILLNLACSRKTEWLFSHPDGSRLKDIEDIRGTKVCYNKDTGEIEHVSTKWYKLLEDLNIEYRPLKNCRHTFTMAMLESNDVKITSLADMLGHSSTNMIINHYAKSIQGKAMEINEEAILY